MVASMARLQRGNGGHVDNVVRRRSARKIAARPSEPLNDRSDRRRARDSLHQLVRDVPGVERREHENVRAAGHGTPRSLSIPDGRNQRRISLQFSVHNERRCFRSHQIRRRFAPSRPTAPAPLPAVEKDSMATHGSSPTMRRRSAAAAIAMSASCSALGYGTTAQSVNVSTSPASPRNGDVTM